MIESMSGAEIGLALSVFLACGVEAVEALTIVLAVGVTRGWSSAMSGVGAALVALSVIVAALGPALTSLPIDLLRAVIGGLLLIFGLQWLRKAILRAAGLKAKHDERRIYRLQAQAAGAAGATPSGFDGYAFTVCFKGVLLEGLEVAFIVLTFGANQHRVGLAGAAAGIAVLLVLVVGVAVRAPLAAVPENAMKFAVGVMLSSFGMFWGAEGAGASWPGGDAALLAIVPGVLLVAVVLTGVVRRALPLAPSGESLHISVEAVDHPTVGGPMTRVKRLFLGVREFVVGEDWRTALGVVLALMLTALLAERMSSDWWVMTIAVVGLLALSVRTASRNIGPAT
jgi:uncharacterized membrane protein